jgi:hypothetical protein
VCWVIRPTVRVLSEKLWVDTPTTLPSNRWSRMHSWTKEAVDSQSAMLSIPSRMACLMSRGPLQEPYGWPYEVGNWEPDPSGSHRSRIQHPVVVGQVGRYYYDRDMGWPSLGQVHDVDHFLEYFVELFGVSSQAHWVVLLGKTLVQGGHEEVHARDHG